MQRIIIDTNVIVSALISKNGIPAKIVNELIFGDRVIVCTSDEIMKSFNNGC